MKRNEIFAVSRQALFIFVPFSLSRWMNKLRPSRGKCFTKLCLERRTSQIIIHNLTLNFKYPECTSYFWVVLELEEFDLNRIESHRIFIAFISESIEKFTALEILSGTLQFTCYSLALSLTLPLPPRLNTAIDIEGNSSNNSSYLPEREWEREFILGNFWHAAKKVAQVQVW